MTDEIVIETIGPQETRSKEYIELLMNFLKKPGISGYAAGSLAENTLLAKITNDGIWMITKISNNKAALIGAVVVIANNTINQWGLYSLALKPGMKRGEIIKILKKLKEFACFNKNLSKISVILAKQEELETREKAEEYLKDSSFVIEIPLQNALRTPEGYIDAWLCSAPTTGREIKPFVEISADPKNGEKISSLAAENARLAKKLEETKKELLVTGEHLNETKKLLNEQKQASDEGPKPETEKPEQAGGLSKDPKPENDDPEVRKELPKNIVPAEGALEKNCIFNSEQLKNIFHGILKDAGKNPPKTLLDVADKIIEEAATNNNVILKSFHSEKGFPYATVSDAADLLVDNGLFIESARKNGLRIILLDKTKISGKKTAPAVQIQDAPDPIPDPAKQIVTETQDNAPIPENAATAPPAKPEEIEIETNPQKIDPQELELPMKMLGFGKNTKRIFMAVLEHPGIQNRGLENITGITQNTLSMRIRKPFDLINSGLIVKRTGEVPTQKNAPTYYPVKNAIEKLFKLAKEKSADNTDIPQNTTPIIDNPPGSELENDIPKEQPVDTVIIKTAEDIEKLIQEAAGKTTGLKLDELRIKRLAEVLQFINKQGFATREAIRNNFGCSPNVANTWTEELKTLGIISGNWKISEEKGSPEERLWISEMIKIQESPQPEKLLRKPQEPTSAQKLPVPSPTQKESPTPQSIEEKAQKAIKIVTDPKETPLAAGIKLDILCKKVSVTPNAKSDEYKKFVELLAKECHIVGYTDIPEACRVKPKIRITEGKVGIIKGIEPVIPRIIKEENLNENHARILLLLKNSNGSIKKSELNGDSAETEKRLKELEKKKIIEIKGETITSLITF